MIDQNKTMVADRLVREKERQLITQLSRTSAWSLSQKGLCFIVNEAKLFFQHGEWLPGYLGIQEPTLYCAKVASGLLPKWSVKPLPESTARQARIWWGRMSIQQHTSDQVKKEGF